MTIFRFLFSLRPFAFILLEFCLVLSFSQAQTSFQRTYGGTSNDYGYSVQQTSDGGYIIVGETNSFGVGADDVYLVKTNSSGDTLWTRTYGGTNHDGGYIVRQTSDGGYIIAGESNSFGAGSIDVYLVKTNSLGDTLWTRTYGGTSDDGGYSVRQTSDGGYIIAGHTLSFGAGSYDVYLVKTNSSGDTLWTRTYGGTSGDWAASVQETSDSGYIIAGYTGSFGGGTGSVYLVKTNSSGDTLWTRTYGGPGGDAGYSVRQTSDGGYIITGFTGSFGAGSIDVYLVKTNSSGDTLWTRTYGGIGNDNGWIVQQTSDGGYIIAGFTGSFGAGSYDVYLVKTNSSGDTLWTRTYGDTSIDYGYFVQQTSDGGYIIAGYTPSFGAGENDVYLIKTLGDGTVSVQDDRSIIPTGFALLQNYPNPFNPTTKFGMRIASASGGGLVSLKVYNLLGQEIATLVNEVLSPGTYEITWDASGLASGVYMYRMAAGDFMETRRLVLLK